MPIYSTRGGSSFCNDLPLWGDGGMGGRRELEGGDLNYKMFSIAARSCWFLPILADVKFP